MKVVAEPGREAPDGPLERRADNRGRVSLGNEFSDRVVTLVVDPVSSWPLETGRVYVVDHDAIETVEADGRGRVNLGMDRSGADVELAILDVE